MEFIGVIVNKFLKPSLQRVGDRAWGHRPLRGGGNQKMGLPQTEGGRESLSRVHGRESQGEGHPGIGGEHECCA